MRPRIPIMGQQTGMAMADTLTTVNMIIQVDMNGRKEIIPATYLTM